MKIDITPISQYFQKLLNSELKKLKKNKPKLTIINFNKLPKNQLLIKLFNKYKIHYHETVISKIPYFESLLNTIRAINNDKTVNGIIINQPLPAQLSTDSIYGYIYSEKEIEGRKPKSFFYPPVGLMVLIFLKYAFVSRRIDKNLIPDLKKDIIQFKKIFKHKRVVLIGRGLTGGQLIGRTLSLVKINYLNINSTTNEPENYLKNADVIISAVGKKIIKPEYLKPGVVLINIGLDDHFQGDYLEKEIKDIAGFYTAINKDMITLENQLLILNLIEAAKLQK